MGHLAVSVGRAHYSSPRGQDFEPHVECRDDINKLKKKIKREDSRKTKVGETVATCEPNHNKAKPTGCLGPYMSRRLSSDLKTNSEQKQTKPLSSRR